MANSPGAKKRVRTAERRTAINKSRRSRVRTFIRRVEDALRGGDAEKANAALKDAQSEIMRGVSKGILHQNTASRKVSRLAARVKAISV